MDSTHSEKPHEGHTGKPGITILGLGPGAPGQLTRQAWEWLNQIDVIYLRTNQHPNVKSALFRQPV